MGNRSYCRFRNTLEDLKDCHVHLFDEDISPDELKARNDLITVCQAIAQDIQNQEDDE